MVKALLLFGVLIVGYMVLNGTLDVSNVPIPMALFALFSAGLIYGVRKI